jgi:hypothetical protein
MKYVEGRIYHARLTNVLGILPCGFLFKLKTVRYRIGNDFSFRKPIVDFTCIPLARNKGAMYLSCTDGTVPLSTELVEDIKEVPANDLPLYLNMYQIYPAFREVLDGL